MQERSLQEQEPLLESQNPRQPYREEQTWKSRLGRKLESNFFHKFVLTLISIDALCVLADITYTFLSDDCSPVDSDNVPLWLSILSHISFVITSFFLIEIPLSIYAFGFSHYNPFSGTPHASLHLFDAIIIIVTFVLEAILRGREQELVGLLILFRLWRLVKLVGGMAVGAGEFDEELSRSLVETQEQLNQYKEILQKSLDENQRLKQRIATLEQANH